MVLRQRLRFEISYTLGEIRNHEYRKKQNVLSKQFGKPIRILAIIIAS